jgi:membrane fusion protein (multidrug efflux system)
VFSIVNLDSLIAVVHVPEREIGRVRHGQKVTISSDFMEEEEMVGWVKRISPVVDPNSGTFKVTVGLKNHTIEIKPGMFVNVHIVTDTHDNAILVPRDAIVYDGGREYIFLASEESTATKIELDKGFSDNRTVEVLSGVENNDMVIVVGQSGIKDGAKVKILDDEQTRDTEEEELAVDSTEHSRKL